MKLKNGLTIAFYKCLADDSFRLFVGRPDAARQAFEGTGAYMSMAEAQSLVAEIGAVLRAALELEKESES